MTYIERVGVYFYATSACGLQCVIHLSRGEGGHTGACADPEGGTGGPDPPWNLKILPKKR